MVRGKAARQYIASGDFGTRRDVVVALPSGRGSEESGSGKVECFVSEQRELFRGIRLGQCGGILELRNSPAG
jgi:hypothetical protein